MGETIKQAVIKETIINSTANVNLIILCLLSLSEHQAKRGVETGRNGLLAVVRNSTPQRPLLGTNPPRGWRPRTHVELPDNEGLYK